MRIQHLSLTQFRGYTRLELTLPAERPIVLHGANAQGKTSLLESIYVLASGRSPYTTNDRQMIQWAVEDDPLPYARISAVVESKRAASTRLELTIQHERSGGDGVGRTRKIIRVNSVEKRLRDVVGSLSVVLFLPQDLILIEGAPADRRRFIDNTLAQVDGDYLEALDLYERVLPQRNALLRRIAERQADVRELTYWDEKLVASGSQIIALRQRFLRALQDEAQRAHRDLTGGRELLTLRYQPSFLPTTGGTAGQFAFDLPGLDLHRDLSVDQIAAQFADRLVSERDESIQRGMTLSGPHRDELRLLINDRDAGLYGSRGQARTIVLACKLAEVLWMRDQLGEWPLLLLDEVAAELDAERRAYLLRRIDGVTQTLMTTTEIDIFTRDFLDRAAIWQVAEGRIRTTG